MGRLTTRRAHDRRREWLAATLVASLVLVAASCGDGEGSAAEAPATNTAAPEPPDTTFELDEATTTATSGPTGADTSAPPGTPVPEILAFDAALVGGGTFAGADVAGGDTVFWFWAPWCPTCAAAAGDVLAATESYPDVTFVGVGGLSSDAGSMEQFVADHGIDGFDQIADVDGDVYTRFGVVQQHTFAFVSADGDVETVPAYGLDVDITALVDEMFG
jgi:thiol-disulfide isomerase/thioredoxin